MSELIVGCVLIPVNKCTSSVQCRTRLANWQTAGFIAECSEANNRDLGASESQLAFISDYICRSRFPGLGGQARVQNGDSDS